MRVGRASALRMNATTLSAVHDRYIETICPLLQREGAVLMLVGENAQDLGRRCDVGRMRNVAPSSTHLSLLTTLRNRTKDSSQQWKGPRKYTL
jgi:hypothetical protein